MVDPAPDIGRGVFILLKQGCIGPHTPTTQIIELVTLRTQLLLLLLIVMKSRLFTNSSLVIDHNDALAILWSSLKVVQSMQ